MKSGNGVRLRSDVSLIPLGVEHAENMYRWMCDPIVSANVGLRSEASLERTVAWIEGALEDNSIRAFAVLYNDNHVGNVILDRIDRYLESARLSVYMGESEARGAGIASTAMYRLLQEGFDKLSLHKIWLTVHARNYAGINAYTRLGFMLEGIMRDEFVLNGERLNALYMGILDDEFRRLAVIEEAKQVDTATGV